MSMFKKGNILKYEGKDSVFYVVSLGKGADIEFFKAVVIDVGSSPWEFGSIHHNFAKATRWVRVKDYLEVLQ